jgi:ankyrin repeat protein
MKLRAFSVLSSLAAAALISAATLPPEAPVADAAMRGDTSAVRALIQQGADVNAAQGDGMTALHWSAASGDTRLTSMLLFAGARFNAKTRNGNYTPLHVAAKAGKAGPIAVLLKAGADPNGTTSAGGAAALHLAVGSGDDSSVAALLHGGAKVDQREGAWEQTPLMWAAAYNRVGAISLLLAAGADIKAISRIEDTSAREKADRQGNIQRQRRVAALKAANKPLPTPSARPAAPPAKDSAAKPPRPDSAAARKDSTSRATATPRKMAGTDSAKTDRKAPVATKDSARAPAPSAKDSNRVASTSTAADDSARRAATRVLSYAEMVGNRGGLTPLLYAVREGNEEAAMALVAAGADVNMVSSGDSTSPLLMATINGHFDLARELLAKGANPKLASKAGATPLYTTLNIQWAAKSLYPQPTAQRQQKTDYMELMELLITAGADVNARLKSHLWYMSYNFDLLGVNTQGATPFWRAAYALDVPAMKMLLKHGADYTIPTTKPAGRLIGDDGPGEQADVKDPSGLPPIPNGGPGVYPLQAASGVGYGEGFAANSHVHAPDAWMPAVRFLIEELKVDVNSRDHNGFTALHHAAARGDNEMIEYLVSKGGDIAAVSRRGQTVTDMANGPVQRVPPFLSTVELTMKLGSKNSNKCKSC